MPQMKAPFYGHTRQYESIQKELDDAIRDVILSGQYVTGPTLKRFEGELARYCGQKHAVGVNSGTDALWLTFMALGLKEGDEVITTANTFFATAEAIWIAGGRLTNARKPGKRRSCGRSCWATCAAVAGRSRRGVSWTLNRAMFIDPMHLKNTLCQIDSNRRNLHGDAPFRLSGRIALPLWHLDAVSERGRPSH